MKGAVANKAEIEYAVMLAVLDFQTEFMKSAYSQVQAHVFDELIYVTSTRRPSIPAEKELARARGGDELLRQFHRALFNSCEDVLKKRIKQAIGVEVHSISTDFDPSIGRSTLTIRLQESLATRSC
jgi:uncharacterized protein YbcI